MELDRGEPNLCSLFIYIVYVLISFSFSFLLLFYLGVRAEANLSSFRRNGSDLRQYLSCRRGRRERERESARARERER